MCWGNQYKIARFYRLSPSPGSFLNLYEQVYENCSEEEIDFKRNTFCVIFDSVICGREDSPQGDFAKKYYIDVVDKLSNEVIHFRHVYDVRLTPYNLLIAINARKLERFFPNICIALRIFCIPPI